MDGNKITLKNNGTKPVPLILDVIYEDDSTKRIAKSARIWSDQKEVTLEIENVKKVKMIVLNKQVPDFKPLNNYFPPIDEIYATYDLPSDAVGSYKIDQFPVTAVLTEKSGAYYMDISGTSISTYLLPLTDTSFESLDGSLKMKFVIENGQITGLNIDVFGFELTSSKQ